MEFSLESCTLCPHKCLVNRKKAFGKCKASDKIRVSRAALHFFEEPCISGKYGDKKDNNRGSGTVFFSNCNLKCVFCQNYKISHEGYGVEVSIEDLSKIFLKLQENGAYNINLVSPTIYWLQIKEAIKLAKKEGLAIPIIYNTSGYENKETIESLDGYVDVYLPDFKYFDNEVAKKYSKVDNYFEYASQSIKKMYEQVGNPIFDNNGIIKRGLIIRHLILPNNISQTRKILSWIKDNLGNKVYISIMAQYFPAGYAKRYSKINRKITKKELNIVKLFLKKYEFENGYIQKLGEHEEEYVPDIDLTGIL